MLTAEEKKHHENACESFVDEAIGVWLQTDLTTNDTKWGLYFAIWEGRGLVSWHEKRREKPDDSSELIDDVRCVLRHLEARAHSTKGFAESGGTYKREI